MPWKECPVMSRTEKHPAAPLLALLLLPALFHGAGAAGTGQAVLRISSVPLHEGLEAADGNVVRVPALAIAAVDCGR
jgi:hypothetical protein